MLMGVHAGAITSGALNQRRETGNAFRDRSLVRLLPGRRARLCELRSGG